MEVKLITNIGLILLAVLLIAGGGFFLASGALHLTALVTTLVYSGFAAVAIASGVLLLLGK